MKSRSHQYHDTAQKPQIAAVAHEIESSTSTTTMSQELSQPQFTIFNNLPAEIRGMIWRYASSGPRAIHIKPATKSTHSFIIPSELAAAKIKAVTSIPGVLQAVYESREVALNHYTIAFADQPRIPSVFFNYEHDYLHISIALLASLFPTPYTEKSKDKSLIMIRNLMIGPICSLHSVALERKLNGYFEALRHVIIPHMFAPGDMRKARTEKFGKVFFKTPSSDGRPGLELDFKSPLEILELSRNMRLGL